MNAEATRHPPLQREFYARPVVEVARSCIGKLLVCSRDGRVALGRVVETEAYRGPEDRAAHSFGGRRTPRTAAMFGPAGHAYVFFVYGMHWHFNLVTGQPGQPHAVLIRAVEPLAGRPLMARRRGKPADSPELTNGPGKLCQALGIDRRFYGDDLCVPRGVWLSENPPGNRVRRSPRVGIDYAGEWVSRPWRFFEADNRYVSKPPRPHARCGKP